MSGVAEAHEHVCSNRTKTIMVLIVFTQNTLSDNRTIYRRKEFMSE